MNARGALRIAFAGTPPFAAAALAAILDAGHAVPLVLSQPDRAAGRGQQLRAGAVKALALARGIAVHTPATLRRARGDSATLEALAALRAASPDALVVAAYGLLLPAEVLAIPRGLGGGADPARAINIHASLLPRWRGAAPIVRAIEAGDRMTGITIMQMDEGLDTGPMLARAELAIGPGESAGELTARLADLGARSIVAALGALARGALPATPQPGEGATYAAKVSKDEAWLDWNEPAQRLADRVRAFDPFPGACSALAGTTIKVWRARAHGGASGAPAGTVLAAGGAGLHVACGEGVLVVSELQRPGARRLPAREFLAGFDIPPGSVFARGAATA